MNDTRYIEALAAARTMATVTGSVGSTHTEQDTDGNTIVTATWERTPEARRIAV